MQYYAIALSNAHVQVDSPPIPPISPHLAEELQTIVQDTYSRMANLDQGKCIDSRPAHIVTYSVHSGATRDLIKGLILEMIIEHLSDAPGRNHLKILAQKEFLALLSVQGMQGDIDVSGTHTYIYIYTDIIFRKELMYILRKVDYYIMESTVCILKVLCTVSYTVSCTCIVSIEWFCSVFLPQ